MNSELKIDIPEINKYINKYIIKDESYRIYKNAIYKNMHKKQDIIHYVKFMNDIEYNDYDRSLAILLNLFQRTMEQRLIWGTKIF